MFSFIETRLFSYYVRREDGVIWMLTMYPKNVAASIPAHLLREIREEIEGA